MDRMEFGWRWRRWIKGCFSFSRASVLINVSPTKEFDIKRGVRQGYLFSLFLFIIAMEGLHVSMKATCDLHYFRGISLSYYGISISYLMYANDATFNGEWSKDNFNNLNRLLRRFFLASVLKVNMHKSKVYDVGLDGLEVERLVSILCCEASSFLFFVPWSLGSCQNLLKIGLRWLRNLNPNYLCGKRDRCLLVVGLCLLSLLLTTFHSFIFLFFGFRRR